MFQCFLIGCKKGGMEDGMNLPPRWDAETEGHVGDDLFDFKGTRSLHLEFLWSMHMKVGGFEPDSVSYFPRGEFGGNPFLLLLLGNLVSSSGIVMSSGKIQELGFQIG